MQDDKLQLLQGCELPSSKRGSHGASTPAVHGAVLGLAGRLLAWMRPWDAPIASRSAHTGLLGCTDTMVITIVKTMQYGAGNGLEAGI